MLISKVVVVDIFGGNTEGVEHVEDGLEHHRRATDIVLNFFGGGMVFKVLIIDDLMDEAGRTGPVVIGQRVGEGDMEGEVVVFALNFLKIIHIFHQFNIILKIVEGFFVFGKERKEGHFELKVES